MFFILIKLVLLLMLLFYLEILHYYGNFIKTNLKFHVYLKIYKKLYKKLLFPYKENLFKSKYFIFLLNYKFSYFCLETN